MENPGHSHTYRMCKMWRNLMTWRSDQHSQIPPDILVTTKLTTCSSGREHSEHVQIVRTIIWQRAMYSNTANTSIQANIFQKPRHVYGTRTVAHVLQLQLATIWTLSMLGASQSAKTFCWMMRILIMVLNVRRAFQWLFADIWFWRWRWLVASICHFSW